MKKYIYEYIYIKGIFTYSKKIGELIYKLLCVCVCVCLRECKAAGSSVSMKIAFPSMKGLV